MSFAFIVLLTALGIASLVGIPALLWLEHRMLIAGTRVDPVCGLMFIGGILALTGWTILGIIGLATFW